MSLATSASAVSLSPVVGGLDRPLYVTHAGDGSGRLFIVEQAGVVKVLAGGVLRSTPFIDFRSIVGSTASEQGLLGMAFHPLHALNGEVILSYTNLSGDSVIARYRVSADPNVLDAASARVILTLDQPYSNHNGGHVAFGRDGYLYIGFGDGGSGGDPHGHGQNTATLLGDLLRIDVNLPIDVPIDVGVNTAYLIPPTNPHVLNPPARAEIWASGLRNPWRFSFDRLTGDLWIGDVGQNAWEEVNFQPASSPGGENYGWDLYEGNHPFQPAPPGSDPPPQLVFPVAEYAHAEGCSVTGGYVYQGPSIASLRGAYVFGDFCNGTIWTLRPAGGGVWTRAKLLDTSLGISSFGEDEAGELYVTDHFAGAVYRFVQ